MTWGQLVLGCIGVSAILGAAYGAWQAAKAVGRGVRKAVHGIDKLVGDGAERKGILEQVDDNTTLTAEIAKALADLKELFSQQLASQGEALAQQAVRLGAVEDRLTAVEGQLKTNGGNSARDVLDRVEKAVTASDASPFVEAA